VAQMWGRPAGLPLLDDLDFVGPARVFVFVGRVLRYSLRFAPAYSACVVGVQE